MEILKTQLTLLTLITLGIIGRKAGIFDEKGKKVLAHLLYYFLVPALFFLKVSEMKLMEIDISILWGSLLPIIIIMIILLVLKLFSILSLEVYILLNLSICFGSNAFFGVAFFTNLYGETGQEFSVMTATILGIFGIMATTLLFEFSQPGKKTVPRILNVFKSPIVLSVFAGILFSLLQWEVPLVSNALSMLAVASSGLSIFILGMFLYDYIHLESIKKDLLKAALYGLFRFFALPVTTIIIIVFILKTPGMTGQFLVIQSGIPAAISIAVFSEKYNWKQDIVPQIVVVTSLLSFLSLTALYFLMNSVSGLF